MNSNSNDDKSMGGGPAAGSEPTANSKPATKPRRTVQQVVDAWWTRCVAGSEIARHTPLHNALLREIPNLVRRLEKGGSSDKAWREAIESWRAARITRSRIGRHEPCMAALDTALKQLTPKE